MISGNLLNEDVDAFTAYHHRCSAKTSDVLHRFRLVSQTSPLSRGTSKLKMICWQLCKHLSRSQFYLLGLLTYRVELS